MLNVYLLRHGQTAWNADNNRYCGRTDLPLTNHGIEQAKWVANQLEHIHFQAAYSSPLKRAVDTARIIAGSEDVIIDDRLIEVDFGNWEGKTREEFIRDNPSSWENWNADPLTANAGETGESAAAVIRRADAFFQSVSQKHTEGDILVLAHNTVNRLYMAYKLGMHPRDYRKIFIDNSSVSMFELNNEDGFVLKHLNSGQKE